MKFIYYSDIKIFSKRVVRYIVRKYKLLCDSTVNRSIGVIYMLHRVTDIDNSKFLSNEELKVSPKFLEEYIISVKDQYDFISIDDLIIYNKERRKFKKPFIIFTIDDGYKDNYTKAYPIFKKYNIPFVIYLATDLIDNDKPYLWWYYLEQIITNHNTIELSTGEVYNCFHYDDKLHVFDKLRRRVLDLPSNNSESLFRSLFVKYNSELSVNYSELMLNWEEIKLMIKDPLCTIGAHTKSHCRLSLLSTDELNNEILQSKEIIENHIDKKVEHFSYPYGSQVDISSEIFAKISEFNFKSAVVSFGGNIRRFTKSTFALPRVMLKEDIIVK